MYGEGGGGVSRWVCGVGVRGLGHDGGEEGKVVEGVEQGGEGVGGVRRELRHPRGAAPASGRCYGS